MSTIFGDIRFARGLEKNLPSLEEGKPALTTDTKRVFVGSDEGNLEIARIIDVNLVGNEVSDARGGLPSLDERLDALDQSLSTHDQSLSTHTINITDLQRKTDWVDVSKFGYDLAALNAAIATLKEGDTLYFPNAVAPYQLIGGPITISIPNITLRGNGLLQMDYGFRPTESGFTIDGLRMEATAYSSNARGVYVAEPVDGKFISNFKVMNCRFKNFFYAADFRGGTYEVTGLEAAEGFPVRDVMIFNNYSETYTTQNAGHFNCTQVENITYAFNKTYGGQNATSYNVIKGNGSLKIIGNYDHDNSYGSCEVENLGSEVIIMGNTFKKQIWVDDSSNVIISNNTVKDDIFISVEKYGTNNITIVNNIVARVKLDTFGSNYVAGMLINNVTISNNKFINGASKSYGVYMNGPYVGKVTVNHNEFPATDYSTGKIGGIRSSTLDLTLRGNDVNGNVVISGTGGKVTSITNAGISFTSTNADDGDTCSALPAASSSLRGRTIILRKGTGVADELYVCRKQTDDTYAWVKVI
jgi:hypothetical protein